MFYLPAAAKGLITMTVVNSLPTNIIHNVNDLLELLECECIDELENFDDTGCSCNRYEFIQQKNNYYTICDNNKSEFVDNILEPNSIWVKLEVDKLDRFTYLDGDPYCISCTNYLQNNYIGCLFTMAEAYAVERYEIRYCANCREIIEDTLPINMWENNNIEELIEDEIELIDDSHIRNFITNAIIKSLYNDGRLASEFTYYIYANDHDILLVNIVDSIVSNIEK